MPNVSPPQSSPTAPSVVWDGTKFWMTWLSNSGDNAIFYATSTDGANWANIGTIFGQSASAPPAIALRHGVPVIVYAQVPPGSGAPPTILWTQWDSAANAWTGAQQVASGDSASAVSAIAKSDGSVLILFREATTSTIDYTTF